jgi:hypothetical protein
LNEPRTSLIETCLNNGVILTLPMIPRGLVAYRKHQRSKILDTSGPNYGRHAFPNDIDESPKLNDLQNFYCPDGWGKAHVFISRTGELLQFRQESGHPDGDTRNVRPGSSLSPIALPRADKRSASIPNFPSQKVGTRNSFP